LYVAPDGNDAWSGQRAEPNAEKADGPFATLERARDEIRKRKAAGSLHAGDFSVEIAEGRYELAQPLILTAEDSGTAQTQIVYRAARGKQVRLSGGRVLSGWQPVRDSAVLERLPAAARDKVVQVDLRSSGVTDFGKMGGGFGRGGGPGLELFFKRCALYGIYPSIGRYCDKTYEQFPDIYKTYIPILRKLGAAGWEPVTHASTAADKIVIERFGPKDGSLFFTVYNESDREKQIVLSIDLPSLGVKKIAAASELVTHEEIKAGDKLSLSLRPDELKVLALNKE
jgi:hypothetical protein